MDMEYRTRMMLAWELHEQGISNTQIAARLLVHRETAGLWLKNIRQQGLLPFLDTFGQASRTPYPARQVPLTLKQKLSYL